MVGNSGGGVGNHGRCGKSWDSYGLPAGDILPIPNQNSVIPLKTACISMFSCGTKGEYMLLITLCTKIIGNLWDVGSLAFR